MGTGSPDIITADNIGQIDIDNCIHSMASALTQYQAERARQQYELVGIQTGGHWVAKRLSQALSYQKAMGSLNISFYRDDFTRKGLHPHVSPSSLPFEVENAHIVLVDDVIMSGRTIRAALNEIFDFGRPKSVTLVALIDLSANDLPIRPDIVGQRITLTPTQRIKLSGPEPLQLTVREVSS